MALTPKPATNPAALVLTVRQVGNDQFVVENSNFKLAQFDREYVSFGSYFGTHGPDVFAAAPDMLVALQSSEKFVETLHSIVGGNARRIVWRELTAIRAAIAKATGK